VVWRTKNSSPCLTKEIRNILFPHIKENAKRNGIYVDFINGHNEHVHCLIMINADLSIAKTVQLIKGESSNWLNKQEVMASKFSWADDYFAVSVSESMVDKVRDYIKNQEEHHRKVTFSEEYKDFISRYDFKAQG
jgi:putative transposase